MSATLATPSTSATPVRPSATPVEPIATPAVQHPSPCPSWCQYRAHPLGHHFGPSSTAHWSPMLTLHNPGALSGTSDMLLRAELSRIDEGDVLAEQVLYVGGESDVELSAGEADVFIAQLQGFVDGLRMLRGQMR